ncbi:unnamed protein product [Rotaria sp. Silwood2]|nr:unnamed protein product [Rotaria sp. Silwood2]CAF3055785.1 unnamed protein product [Rotaria sp. Silwood2]CAF3500314.1 unnamed protein product [Rotaria sp. Silwood2]CAF3928584.1 unnamed protein product [Rotaria sp. Silwood2]CAF3959636.1 unnamed protein product [Rotaria sp. Silwood2]
MNIEALFQVGAYHADLNEHNQAINIFNKVLELLPDDSRTLQYRGLSYVALDDINKARDDFDNALKMNHSAIIYFERGLLYFKLGNQ